MSAIAPARSAAAIATAPAPTRVPVHHKPSLPRPRLVLVSPKRTSAGRLPFLILVGALLVVGLVAVLFLHMMAAQDSFRAIALQSRLTALTVAEEHMAQQNDLDSSPVVLQRRAAQLGMVSSTLERLHPLRHGGAAGVEAPVIPPPAPAVTKAKPTTSKAAKSAKRGATKQASKAGTTGAKKSATPTKSATSQPTSSPKHQHHRPAKP